MLAQSLIDALPIGLIIADNHLVVTRINRWLAEHLGRAPESVIGRPLGEAFPELAERDLLFAFERVLQGGQPFSLSDPQHCHLWRIPAAQGSPWSEMPLSATIVPLRECGQTIGVLTLIEDLSLRLEAERKQLELSETLRDSVLALAAELDPDAVLDRLLDHVGRVVPFDAACVMLLEEDEIRVKRCRSGEGTREADLGGTIVVPHGDIPHLQQMIQTGRPCVCADTFAEQIRLPFKLSQQVGSWVGAPIIIHGRMLGILSLEKTEAHYYSEEITQPLAAFAAQAGLALENARLYAAQQRLAITDGLTGLFNRRRFDEELARELNRTFRFKHPTALVLLDVDDFKKFNDTYGHPLGDELLKTLGALLGDTVRGVDIPARYGGEEFALILPETSAEGAALSAERVRARVESELAANLDALSSGASSNRGTMLEVPSVTISVGVAVAPIHASSPEQLVQAADAALYQAKKCGKNRVVVWNGSKLV